MGYTSYIFLLSKFRKSFLPPKWNGLFPIMFKSLSEWVSGSDSATKMFYTLCFGLFNGVNLDFGSIIWTQFVQSTSSTTRHTEILCAFFWLIMVKKVLLHYHGLTMMDLLMADIPKLQSTTFIIIDPRNFNFVGSIPEVMLAKVSMENDLIREYCSLTSFGIFPIPIELQVIDTGDKPKIGGKSKKKASSSEIVRVSKKT
ncbi:unnamed protein product [Lactuca saligna]|uniref:Uncharacterized protein n=1 Tax=Lactuca saligna TaxID=75948 RepID=A0AA35YAL9_LACSI|nr:unnamed protein product [Lactuca saligna]